MARSEGDQIIADLLEWAAYVGCAMSVFIRFERDTPKEGGYTS